MTIEAQLKLFYKRLREPMANSRVSPEEALEYLNSARISVAIETKFYQVKDTITAVGGETYWTMMDSFLEPVKARDWATCNGLPVVIKALAEWAEVVYNNDILNGGVKYGVLDGKQFRIHPAATKGDIMTWRGVGAPDPLVSVTGQDAYTDDVEAKLIVLEAVQSAMEDLNREPGPVLEREYKTLKREVKRRARPAGARLETAPQEQ